MLVLRRNISEEILIGENIRIMVVDAGGGWAKIGIDAPKDVPVFRTEVTERPGFALPVAIAPKTKLVPKQVPHPWTPSTPEGMAWYVPVWHPGYYLHRDGVVRQHIFHMGIGCPNEGDWYVQVRPAFYLHRDGVVRLGTQGNNGEWTGFFLTKTEALEAIEAYKANPQEHVKPISELLANLRESSGNAWDDVTDVRAELSDLRGTDENGGDK